MSTPQSKTTDSMKRALHWLSEHGGEGAFVANKHHEGESVYGEHRVLTMGLVAPFAASTFRALLNKGHCQLFGHRIKITQKGHQWIKEHPFPHRPLYHIDDREIKPNPYTKKYDAIKGAE